MNSKTISYSLGATGTIGLFVASLLFSIHSNFFYYIAIPSIICILLSIFFYWLSSNAKDKQNYKIKTEDQNIVSIKQKGGITAKNVNINSQTKESKPTINISLIYISAYGFYFVLENPSNNDAHEITLDIKLRPGQSNPFQQKIYKETFPIKTIYAKDKKQIQTIINPSLNIAYDATWRWQGKNGETISRQDVIKFSEGMGSHLDL